MPVVSPSRYTPASAALSGSYRSTLSAAPGDKPYYRSGTYVSSTVRSSHAERTTEFRSRYSDVDGKRERKTSLVEYSRDADAGRYRAERSESRSRDASAARSECSRSAAGELPRAKRGAPGAAALAMSTVDFYNKYSPANYVPLTQRIQQAQAQSGYGEIARSKSISNDIGRPPAADCRPRRARNCTIAERAEGRTKDGSPSPAYAKRHSLANGARDTNGNEVPPGADARRRLDCKMAVTKLPADESRPPARALRHYLSQLEDCDGTGPKRGDERPVPVHLPPADRNGKTPSPPAAALAARRPSERLASIKNQLDPNNPIGKILEKSTVIQVENGDADHAERKALRGSPETKAKDLKSDIEKQSKAPKHTTNFASYIQISQPVASGATPKKPAEASDRLKNKEAKKSIKYIDSEEDRLSLENEMESPSGTGFENKTFEHENFLKKRTESGEAEAKDDGAKSMETSTESTVSELTVDSSPETPTARRNTLDLKDYDYIKSELAGGKSGPSGVRRSSERADVERGDKLSHTSGLNGLRNIGNTCFMNSVLQCLSNTRLLLEYLADDKYSADINTSLSCMKGALIKAFASVVKELWRGGERDAVVNTTSLKAQVQRFAPRFMGYSQQDAQEFLRYLLEGLHEDVNRVTVKPKPLLTEIDDGLSDSAKAAEAWARYLRTEDSRVGDIFVGQLKSTLRCTHCHHDSVTFDPFWDLSLPIPSRTGNLKLTQCLQHFVREEELDGDEKPTCSKCGVRRKCLKWFTVQKFPQVLVLHLKRFSPTERFRGKLSVVVEFPLSALDMSPFAAAPTHATYNLYAVSNHSGEYLPRRAVAGAVPAERARHVAVRGRAHARHLQPVRRQQPLG
ncbi:ubiquitin carboxyl-terminal hydrolase 37 isoform X1 [Bicyclus anynana]|uniref:ubiquitinyl hydrolase 1 n=1 Tax=Bicyclus anynana TaxID=110368 RepID=A0ABM3LI18_BICAN|nr:ubiquitin carboxyl-terminal hydrolase 37 isoform X1 [Bicyclus anynana]XP_052738698.1 ubiquitin carboxyl-terminal hydrolase 37 isoform X1 [Bicyclus anynana]XP_052738699.1 ubiquitin carboxyl-terminal hydrolase 37 isoform X1 [Bicyclus anynana]